MLFPRLFLPVCGCQFVVFGSLYFAWSGGVPEEFTSFYHLRVKSGKKVVTAGQRVFLGAFFTPFSTFANFFRK